MFMSPIPTEANNAIKKIRRDVPRPSYPPKSQSKDGHLLRWEEKDKECCAKPLHQGLIAVFCPLGLHPKSLCSSPVGAEDFEGGAFKDSEVKSFVKWWDEQKDARAAVNAVWGSKRAKIGNN